MSRPDELFELAQKIADERPAFFDPKGKGAGEGNKATNDFMKKLKERARVEFRCAHLAEQPICGNNEFKVDFYFPEEKTIVEVALSLWNFGSEFEKDIIKAILALRNNHPVNKLLFIYKRRGKENITTRSRQSIIDWVREDYKIDVVLKELVASSRPTSSDVTR